MENKQVHKKKKKSTPHCPSTISDSFPGEPGTPWLISVVLWMRVDVFVYTFFRLHWMRACRVAWTGRCRCGSFACWGIAAWLASSLVQLSGSASCSDPPLPAFGGEVDMGNSLLSQLWGRDGKMQVTHHSFTSSNNFVWDEGGLTPYAEDTTRLHLCVLRHSLPGCVCHRK